MNIIEKLKTNKKKLLVGLTLIIVVMFIFVMFKSYKIAKNRANIDELPLIKSKVMDIKIKQETKESENESNTFYETFDRNKQKKRQLKEINIREEHEEVIQTTEEDNFIENSTPKVVRIELNDSNIESEKKSNTVEPKMEKNTEKMDDTREVIINEKKDVKLDNKNINNILEVVSDNSYRAQLVALKNKQQAVVFVEKTKRRYGEILKNLDVFITEIDLNEKGVFYRVQVGSFSTKNGAIVFCEEYKKLSVGGDLTNCIVVK